MAKEFGKTKVIQRSSINGVCVEHKVTEVQQFDNAKNIDEPSEKDLEKIKGRDIITELGKRSKR